jgi:hypothetical protein
LSNNITFVENTFPFSSLVRAYTNYKLQKKMRVWENQGGVGPMPHWGKQQVVIEYIQRFEPEVFIETGTYKGKMVYAVMPYIEEIYSIELDETHARNAQARFAAYPNIHIIQGESGKVLAELLKTIDKRCLFWLDAHYSGGSTAKGRIKTPIMQEVQCINHPTAQEHAILIDDARCFTGQNDYPPLEYLQRFIQHIHPCWVFQVKDDIIRITQIENVHMSRNIIPDSYNKLHKPNT